MDFFSNLKIFNSLSNNAIRDIYYNCELKEYSRNNIIYQQEDPSSFVYIIQSGEFKVKKKKIIIYLMYLLL